MLELGLSDPGNLEPMDFHKFSFSKLAFMLNVTRKSENKTFLMTRICEFTETWVITQRYIKGHIKARESKSTQQYDCKLFFCIRLDGTCNSIVELSNSTGWGSESMIKVNASTGKEYCEWFVWGVCKYRYTKLIASNSLAFSFEDL